MECTTLNNEKSKLAVSLDESNQQLEAADSMNSELQILVAKQNENVIEAKRDLNEKETELREKQKITYSLNSDILKVKRLLIKNDEILKKKNEIIDRKDDRISELQMKLDETDERLTTACLELERVIEKNRDSSTKKILKGCLHVIRFIFDFILIDLKFNGTGTSFLE